MCLAADPLVHCLAAGAVQARATVQELPETCGTGCIGYALHVRFAVEQQVEGATNRSRVAGSSSRVTFPSRFGRRLGSSLPLFRVPAPLESSTLSDDWNVRSTEDPMCKMSTGFAALLVAGLSGWACGGHSGLKSGQDGASAEGGATGGQAGSFVSSAIVGGSNTGGILSAGGILAGATGGTIGGTGGMEAGVAMDAASSSEAGVSADTGSDASLCPPGFAQEGEACPSPNLRCPGSASRPRPLCSNYGTCVCGADGLWAFEPSMCD